MSITNLNRYGFIVALFTGFVSLCQPAFSQPNKSTYITTPTGIEIFSGEFKCLLSEIDSNIFLVHFVNHKGYFPGQKSYCSLIEPTIQHTDVLNYSDSIVFLFKHFNVQISGEGVPIKIKNKSGKVICTLLSFESSVNSIRSIFSLSKNEMITGGGMRALPIDRRNKKLRLYNIPQYGYEFPSSNLNYSIPFFLSSNHYAIFYDNVSDGFCDIGFENENEMQIGSKGGRQAFYVIQGKKYVDIIEAFTRLSGRQPLPPLWSLGNLQSRMAYKTQKQTEHIAATMLQKGFPLDAMILDLYWFGDSLFGTMGNLAWHKPSWPDPSGMITDFHKKNIKTVLITEPFIVKGSGNFKDACTRKILAKDSLGNPYIMEKFYFGAGGLIDIFDSSASNWIWEKYQSLHEYGVDGWWIDLAEPEMHPDNMIHKDGPAWLIHNAYGHVWDKMLFDNFKKKSPELRLFNLNRSGFAGSQRYSVFPWSGDVLRSWNGLKAQIPLMLGMAICGPAYIHSDLGGFALGTKDEELYTRWLQMGVFSPIFRPHGSGIPSEPIFFSNKTRKRVKKAIQLRYALLPYNYTLCHENTVKGIPLSRPLFLETENAKHFNENDAYFWGSVFLVNPITEKSQRRKNMIFPEGQWIDFYTHKEYNGNQEYSIRLKADYIPVFVRKGSFIPMAYPMMNTGEYKRDSIILLYFASKNKTEYTLFTDDGENALSLENNQFSLVHFKAESDDTLNISIVIEDFGGFYENGLDLLLKIIGLKKTPEKIFINSTELINQKPERITSKGINIHMTEINNSIRVIF